MTTTLLVVLVLLLALTALRLIGRAVSLLLRLVLLAALAVVLLHALAPRQAPSDTPGFRDGQPGHAVLRDAGVSFSKVLR